MWGLFHKSSNENFLLYRTVNYRLSVRQKEYLSTRGHCVCLACTNSNNMYPNGENWINGTIKMGWE